MSTKMTTILTTEEPGADVDQGDIERAKEFCAAWLVPPSKWRWWCKNQKTEMRKGNKMRELEKPILRVRHGRPTKAAASTLVH